MNIYVGRLGLNATENDVRTMFEVYGQVDSIKLIKDKFTGEFRGFGFVEMPMAEQAQEAIAQLNGKDINGNRVVVNEARPQENRGDRRPSAGPRRFNNGGGSSERSGSGSGFGGSRGGFGGSRGGGSDRGGFGGNRSGGGNW